MIKLKRDNLTMAVSTDVQAAAFIRSGWSVVEEQAIAQTESKGKKSGTDKADAGSVNQKSKAQQ